MKKNISLLALVFAMSIMTACSNNVDHKEETNLSEFEYNFDTENTELEEKEISSDVVCEAVVTHDYPVEEKIIKFTSAEEWNNYEFKDSFSLKEISEAFPGKTIFVIQGESSTGSIKPFINKAIIENNTLKVVIGAKLPEIGTCDMAGVFYIFVCDDSVQNIMVNNNLTLKK
jgi:hypothetical protein